LLPHCLAFCAFLLAFQDKDLDVRFEDRFLLGSYAEAIDYVNIEAYLRGFFNWRRDQLILLADRLKKSPSKRIKGVSLSGPNRLKISGREAKYLMEPATALYLIADGLLEPGFGSALEKRLTRRGLNQNQLETIKDHFISLGSVEDFLNKGLDEISAPSRKYFNPTVPMPSQEMYGEMLREIRYAHDYSLPETYAIKFLLGLDVKTRAVLITYIEDVILNGGNEQTRLPNSPISEGELQGAYAHLEESRQRNLKELNEKEK
jgi:hypothetical protein